MSKLTKEAAGAYKKVTPANINTKNSDVMGNKPVLDLSSDTTLGSSVMYNDLGPDTGIGNNANVGNDLRNDGSMGSELGMIPNLPPAKGRLPRQGKSDVTDIVRK